MGPWAFVKGPFRGARDEKNRQTRRFAGHTVSYRGCLSRAQSTKVEEAAPSNPAQRMLNVFLASQYRPKHQGPLITWNVESKSTDSSVSSFRATLVIEPTEQRVQGSWRPDADEARADALKAALDTRRSVLRATPRVVLGEAVQRLLARPISANDIDIVVTEHGPASFSAALHLFPALQGPGEDQLPVKSFIGESSGKQGAVQKAASQALSYFLTSLSTKPLLDIVLKGSDVRTIGRYDPFKTVRFWNAGSATAEQLREKFDKFGELTAIRLEPSGRGNASFLTQVSAFAASRCLHGEPLVDALLCAELAAQHAHEHQGYRHIFLKGSGGPGLARVFFRNAPLGAAPSDVLEKFREAGDVSSLTYWREKKTGRFRGMGHVSYSTREAAELALRRLHGADMEGHELVVTKYERDLPKEPS